VKGVQHVNIQNLHVSSATLSLLVGQTQSLNYKASMFKKISHDTALSHLKAFTIVTFTVVAGPSVAFVLVLLPNLRQYILGQ
jgi:hypothetical protein